MDEDNESAGRGDSKRKKSTLVIIAGWFTILAGLLALSNGVRTIIGESSLGWLQIDIHLNIYSICGMIVMIFGTVAIAGGISALRGKNVSFALAGAALGMIGDGLPGFVLGITALALLFMSNKDL